MLWPQRGGDSQVENCYCRAIQWRVFDRLGTSPIKKPSAVNSLLARSYGSCAPPISVLNCLCRQTHCSQFMSHVQKMLLCFIVANLWLPQSFSSLFHDVPWALGRGCDKDILFLDEHAPELLCVLWQRNFVKRSESCSNLGAQRHELRGTIDTVRS